MCKELAMDGKYHVNKGGVVKGFVLRPLCHCGRKHGLYNISHLIQRRRLIDTMKTVIYL